MLAAEDLKLVHLGMLAAQTMKMTTQMPVSFCGPRVGREMLVPVPVETIRLSRSWLDPGNWMFLVEGLDLELERDGTRLWRQLVFG